MDDLRRCCVEGAAGITGTVFAGITGIAATGIGFCGAWGMTGIGLTVGCLGGAATAVGAPMTKATGTVKRWLPFTVTATLACKVWPSAAGTTATDSSRKAL